MTRFTLDDAQRAHDEWGCNCGPAALAAILDKTLDEVRPHMGDFEAKRYTNPTLMFKCLERLGAPHWKCTINPRGVPWPIKGLARIQWEGPWTLPGVPLRARYRYSHWVAVRTHTSSVAIFDVNCLNNGTGWVSLDDWSRIVAPFLSGLYKRASGAWSPTHFLELFKPSPARDAPELGR